MANGIHFYLIQNKYVDRQHKITQEYHDSKKEGRLADLPEDLIEYSEEIFRLIDSVFSENSLPTIDNDRTAKTNALNEANFNKQEFQELWKRINTKAVYQVDFDSEELIERAVLAIDQNLRVQPIRYIIEGGEQNDGMTSDQLEEGTGFTQGSKTSYSDEKSINSKVPYDLIGKIAEGVKLTRRSVASILSKIKSEKFDLFKANPEEFIMNSIRLINEQKATTIVERITYDALNDKYDNDIFTNSTERISDDSAVKLNKHVFNYVATDSKKEKIFAEDLDINSDVVVYSKLPRGFSIPTPVGNYNPDWAIAFDKDKIKQIYFVAETKGSMQTLDLRGIERTKVECAKKFFSELNQKINEGKVSYDVVDNYDNLLKLVS